MNTDNTNSFMIAGFHNKLLSNPGFSFLMSERMIRHVWGEGEREGGGGGGYGSIGLEPWNLPMTAARHTPHLEPASLTRIGSQFRF